MQFELTDSRRLTGANLYWEYPSAIIDVSIKCAPEEIIAAWEKAAREWLDPVGYAEQKTCYRVYDGGASLLVSAPIDVLYSMCELNETAWASAVASVTGGTGPDPGEETPRLVRLFDEERNPDLLALQEAARKHLKRALGLNPNFHLRHATVAKDTLKQMVAQSALEKDDRNAGL